MECMRLLHILVIKDYCTSLENIIWLCSSCIWRANFVAVTWHVSSSAALRFCFDQEKLVVEGVSICRVFRLGYLRICVSRLFFKKKTSRFFEIY